MWEVHPLSSSVTAQAPFSFISLKSAWINGALKVGALRDRIDVSIYVSISELIISIMDTMVV